MTAYTVVQPAAPRPGAVAWVYVAPRPVQPAVPAWTPQREPFGPAEINGIRMLERMR